MQRESDAEIREREREMQEIRERCKREMQEMQEIRERDARD